MSCPIGDENEENCSDYVNNSIINSSRLDSGYLTFTSPCGSSPCRLSPCSVVLTKWESPSSEYDPSSPIPAAKQHFLSTIDYERYISTRKHFDILTQLHSRNTFHLIDQILWNLSDRDLKSCTNVCRDWFSILKDYGRRKKTKHVKRILFEQSEKPERKMKLTSTPMQTVTNLLDMRSNASYVGPTHHDENVLGASSTPEKSVHLTMTTATTTTTRTTNTNCGYDYLKYFHGPTIMKRCPICAYVSIIDINDQHGICTNALCQNSFCHLCSGPYHPSSPCRVTTGPIRSPWRQRPKISPIFSNKTRTNLRRLLLR